jgi:microcystin-dependent protein
MINFPDNPTVGQTFTAGGLTWQWDGTKWIMITAPGGTYVPLAGGIMTGPLVLSGDPTLLLGAATKQYVDSIIKVGSMMMWCTMTPPPNWLLCDGTIYLNTAIPILAPVLGNRYGGVTGTSNAVPNMVAKFILGAGGAYSLNATGGEVNHTLTTAEMPVHAHTLTDPTHNHGHTDPGHNHGHSDPGHNHGHTDPGHAHSIADPGHVHSTGQQYLNPTGGSNVAGGPPWGFPGAINVAAAGTGIGIYAVGTGMVNVAAGTGMANVAAVTSMVNVAAGTGITMANAGSGSPHNNMPPYIAIPIIMRYQ